MTMYLDKFLDRSFDWSMTSGLRVILIIVVMMVLLRVVRVITQKLQGILEGTLSSPSEIKRTTTLAHVVRDIGRTAVLGVGVLMLLSELGLDLKPLLAAAGIGGLAIGFGGQNLVKDVISGYFILLEDQIRVGDVVEIAGVGGLVEDVRLRTIVLRDLSGSVHVVPNSTVDKVKNMSKGYSYSVFDVGVSYREDVDEVMAVLKEIAAGLQADSSYSPDILEPLEMWGVDQFADSAVIIKCRIKTKPMQQWRVGREMNRRIKKTFDARGIEIPFPHRTVLMGEPKKGVPLPV